MNFSRLSLKNPLKKAEKGQNTGSRNRTVTRNAFSDLKTDYQVIEQTFREAGVKNPEKVAHVMESLFASGAIGGYDPDANLTAQQGGSLFYRRLTQAARDLNPLIHTRAIEIAAWLYDTNPMAKRLLEIPRDYILGEGVSVVALYDHDEQRDQIQEVIDRFWNDPFNDFNTKLYNKTLELGLFGEIVSGVEVNKVNGHARLSVIDPSMVADVITDPLNVEVVRALSIRSQPLQGVNTMEDYRLKVISLIDDPNDPWYGRLIGVKKDADGNILDTYQLLGPDGKPVGDPIPYNGACFFFRVNNVSTSKRGRSDLLSLIDYVDAYDQLIFSEIDRMMMIKAHIWDVTLSGMNESEISKWLKDNGNAPKPGTVRAHNEKVVWNSVAPSLNESDTAVGADLVLSLIATGAGKPKTWLNGTMDVNKSASEELSEPAFKSLTARQKVIKAMISTYIKFALDQAEMSGYIPKRDKLSDGLTPEPWKFAINMPDLRASDLNASAVSFQDTLMALSIAKQDRFLDTQSIQEIIKVYAAQFGVELDLDTVNERIDNENKLLLAAQQQNEPTDNNDGDTGTTGVNSGKGPNNATPSSGTLTTGSEGQPVTGISASNRERIAKNLTSLAERIKVN